eukprot:TRINITY_DN10273_c0_g1_i1.p1 TRINITY_DN10273_c0_g1~~TRINITY_DN10273_c0_g1_i1.p1  ORF type:complete len:814 (+),score=213.56 TRINITY_DN10273_c0_g1_i1:85-2526(+)
MGDIAAILFAYSRRRKDLGRPPDFKDAPPDTIVDFPTDHRRCEQWTRLARVECEVSNIPSVSELGTNTKRTVSRTRGQLHLEGSWPKDVDDVEHKLRFRKKTEKDDGYVPALKALVSSVEGVLAANNAIDIYEQYFATVQAYTSPADAAAAAGPADTAGSPPGSPRAVGLPRAEPPPAHADPAAAGLPSSIQTLTVFGDPLVTDPRSGRIPAGAVRGERTACCAVWQPVEGHHGRRMAVAYANLRRPHPNATACTLGAHESLNSYIWDLTNSNSPELTLEPPAQLLCLEYNSKDLHLLGGGCQDGSLCCFDCRRGGRAVLTTPLFGDDPAAGGALTGAAEAVGAGALVSIKWLQSTGKGHEVLAANASDTVRIWDTRKLRDPVDTMVLAAPKGSAAGEGPQSLLCLDYEPVTGGPSKFLAGSASGSVFLCSTRGRSPHDRVLSAHSGHHGPVCAVRRSPQVPKAFVTCGDWTVRVWHEDSKAPVITSRYHRSYVVDASWHPIQAGVFVTAQMSGEIGVWNLIYKHSDPLLSVPVTGDRLHCLRLHPGGELAAAGACSGRVHLLRLPRELMEASSHDDAPARERAEVAALLERETIRERHLQRVRLNAQSSRARGITGQLERRRSGDTRAQRQHQEKELLELTARYISEMEASCAEAGGADDVHRQIGTLRQRFENAAPEASELLRKHEQQHQETVHRRASLHARGRRTSFPTQAAADRFAGLHDPLDATTGLQDSPTSAPHLAPDQQASERHSMKHLMDDTGDAESVQQASLVAAGHGEQRTKLVMGPSVPREDSRVPRRGSQMRKRQSVSYT